MERRYGNMMEGKHLHTCAFGKGKDLGSEGHSHVKQKASPNFLGFCHVLVTRGQEEIWEIKGEEQHPCQG